MSQENFGQLAAFDGHLLDGLDFCSKVYALFESIRSSKNGASRLRMRPSRLEKRLLEELLPISKYVQASYRIGRYISICWVDGSQNYDAEIHQCGSYVSENFYPAMGYLEVTCTMHKNDYLLRKLLETKGGAFGLEGISRLKNGTVISTPEGYTGKKFVESYCQIVLNEISKKSKKLYPENTTLIIQCKLNSLYTPDEWEFLISCVAKSLHKTSFREIYLFDPVQQYSHSFCQIRDY